MVGAPRAKPTGCNAIGAPRDAPRERVAGLAASWAGRRLQAMGSDLLEGVGGLMTLEEAVRQLDTFAEGTMICARPPLPCEEQISEVGGIALDDTSIYWAASAIWRMPKPWMAAGLGDLSWITWIPSTP